MQRHSSSGQPVSSGWSVGGGWARVRIHKKVARLACPRPTNVSTGMPYNAPGRWKYFLSHAQRKRSAEAAMLTKEWGKEHCWLNRSMENKSVDAMEEGVKGSETFVCILSDMYFKSDNCCNEMRWAFENEKSILSTYTSGANVDEILNTAPDDFRERIKAIDSIQLDADDSEFLSAQIRFLISKRLSKLIHQRAVLAAVSGVPAVSRVSSFAQEPTPLPVKAQALDPTLPPPSAAQPARSAESPSDAAVQRLLKKVGLDSLEEALSANELDWSCKNLTADDAKVVAYVVAYSSSLTSLSLSFNDIGAEGGAAIVEALKVTGLLTTLDLEGNDLGPEGGVAIAEALKVNSSAKLLAKLLVGPQGELSDATFVSSFADSTSRLLQHKVNSECNVRSTNLDVESAKLLAKVATEKRVMLFGIKHDQKEADFSSEHLGPVDAILVASDLAVSGSLTSLNLNMNKIGAEGGVAIAEALKVNRSLKKLAVPDGVQKHECVVAICKGKGIELVCEML